MPAPPSPLLLLLLLLDLVPIPELVDERPLSPPMPLDDELPLPGAPADVLLSDSTTNWIWPELGSTNTSCTVPRLCELCPRMDWFISLLNRTGLPMAELPWAFALAPRAREELLPYALELSPPGAPVAFDPDLLLLGGELLRVDDDDCLSLSSFANACVPASVVVRQSASALRTVFFIANSLLTSGPAGVRQRDSLRRNRANVARTRFPASDENARGQIQIAARVWTLAKRTLLL